MDNTDPRLTALAELTLESFRVNGRLLAVGDRLAQPLDMSSARWQVLGTLMLANTAITVAEIARRMGLTRQSVQRVADDLRANRLVTHVANPEHPRWKRYQPTASGRRVYRQLERRRQQWATEVVTRFTLQELETAAYVLQKLHACLSDNTEGKP